MIIIDKSLISGDLQDVKFCCDLEKCKGACCVEGDAGAPLEEEEISLLEDFLDEIKPFMTRKGRKVTEKQGVFDYDIHGGFVTPLVDDRECAFANFEKGIACCAIEKAYEAGKIDFRKPLSCHLYPVRISRLIQHEAVNYHKWVICKPALELGKKLQLPLYLFLRDALIRKYGEAWYKNLEDSLKEKR
ncbi:MAG: DUF3109 family protein [Bacteroidetes bacterium]|nr:DUF3109 family protein [Bacteroidota bacterium]